MKRTSILDDIFTLLFWAGIAALLSAGWGLYLR